MGVTQKDFLLKFEDLCGVKKPVFINSQDTFAVGYENLVFAKNLTVEHSIGRIRLTRENSDVVEIWIDVDNHDGLSWKDYKEQRLKPTIDRLNSFGIGNDFIFANMTGRGMHLHVFVADLPFELDMRELFVKTAGKEADPMSKAEKFKMREFGSIASTGKDFTGYVPSPLSEKRLPQFKDPVYPDIQLFHVTKEFLVQLALAEADKSQDKNEKEPLVDYERDGDFMNLYKCPLVTLLAKKAEIDKHLEHAQRLFLMSQFLHFGKASRQQIHKIMKYCSDYDEEYTQKMIDHAMERGYHPFTCKWAKEMLLGCPLDCAGSGGKSPMKFVWAPLSLNEIKQEFHKVLLLSEKDDELIDVLLALILDPCLDSEPIWMFLIAPASSGKTVLLKSLHDDKWSLLVDSITTKSFISGRTTINPVTKKEELVEGLLPKLNKKTLIIKEFTVTLSRGEETRKDIFGQLRGIFDREYTAAFGNYDIAMIPDSWKHVKMGFIAGCTPFIDRYSNMNVILGERYLKIRLTTPTRINATRYAMNLAGKRKIAENYLQKKVKRFLSNLELPKEFEYPQTYEDRIANLAEFVVLSRKPVSETQTNIGTKIYEYEEQDELSTRLAQQLLMLGHLLTVVRGTAYNDAVYKTLVRVAMDTLSPERKQILLYLFSRKEPANQTDIKDALGWGYNKTKHHLKQLAYVSRSLEITTISIINVNVVVSNW